MLGLHFSPGLRFTFSLQSAFYTQSAFTPGPQSVVRSPQSTVHSPQSAIQGTFTYLVSNSVSKAVRFSIGRYEKKREFFDLFAAKFESGAMRFSGGIRSGAGPFQNMDFALVILFLGTVNRQRRTQNPSKSLKKPLLRQKDDYIPQVR